MEEEINLKPYIEKLLENWYWIVGSGIAAAILAFLLTSLISPTYQATALVAIAESRQRVQFDPRIETVPEDLPLRAYPELAESDEVLATLLTQEVLDNATSFDVTSLDELRGVVEAELGGDPSLLRLVVRHEDPETAALLVNTWADLFVGWANRVYGFQGDDQLNFFLEQLEQTSQELATAEAALVDFQTRNRLALVGNELALLKNTQSRYLQIQRDTVLLMQDIEALRIQLEQQDGDEVAISDQITALFLELKAFNANINAPLQIQLDSANSLTQQVREDQIEFLNGLIETLAAKLSQIEDDILVLEPQILALQEEEQNLTIENSRITRDYNIVNDTYTALARQVEQEQITSQDISSGVKLASRASVPERSVAPRRLLNTVVAGTVAGLLAVFVILALGWWQSDTQ
ncbi:MAG: Wzz/FepE/Etk N-terminal domain-containing protein [Chloroflexota bacterium]